MLLRDQRSRVNVSPVRETPLWFSDIYLDRNCWNLEGVALLLKLSLRAFGDRTL